LSALPIGWCTLLALLIKMTIKATEETPKITAANSRKSRTTNNGFSLDSTVDEPSTSTVEVDHLSSAVVKSKKSKRRKRDVGEGEGQSDVSKDAEVKKKNKKQIDKDEADVGGTETAITDERKQVKKKRKRENEATLDGQLEDGPKTSKKGTVHDEFCADKKKKRKNERDPAKDASLKKEKHRTGPDPSKDASLTDQARKGESSDGITFCSPASS